MIRFQQVNKTYPGGILALNHISFHVQKGEMAYLTGHSGAGKSTLLKLISLMERPSGGRVLINDHDLSRIRKSDIPFVRRDIGIIFQNHRLLPEHTIFDNVALPLVIAGYGHQQITKRVHAALEKVNLLSKVKSYPAMLSGGEQQRIGIARAIVHSPPLILADEPTGNLDPELSKEIMDLFRLFNANGTSILIATHDLGLIARSKFRVLTLNKGQLIEDPLLAN